MTDADAIAQWMIERISAAGPGGVEQATVVGELEQRFGEDGVRQDAEGRTAVARRVLTRFRTLHGGAIHWDRDRFAWEWVGMPEEADAEHGL